MPANRNVLAFVMAGGEGSRLHPLTANRCKPAVPFNGKLAARKRGPRFLPDPERTPGEARPRLEALA